MIWDCLYDGFGVVFVTCYVASIGRILSPVDKGCSGMVSGRKRACTGAAKASSGTPGRGIYAVTWLGTPSGTLWRVIPRYSVALHNVNPQTSDAHNFFVRTLFWVFLDSMESSLSL